MLVPESRQQPEVARPLFGQLFHQLVTGGVELSGEAQTAITLAKNSLRSLS